MLNDSAMYLFFLLSYLFIIDLMHHWEMLFLVRFLEQNSPIVCHLCLHVAAFLTHSVMQHHVSQPIIASLLSAVSSFNHVIANYVIVATSRVHC